MLLAVILNKFKLYVGTSDTEKSTALMLLSHVFYMGFVHERKRRKNTLQFGTITCQALIDKIWNVRI